MRLEPTKANLRYAANFKARIEHEISTNTFDYRRHFPESRRAQLFAAEVGLPTLDVGDALERLVNAQAGHVQPETLADYREYARILAKAFPCKLQEISRAQVREWAQSQTISRKRLNNLLIPLRGALRQAHEDGVITSDPLAGFRIGRRVEAPKETIDPLTPQELSTLCKTATGAYWQFWAWTGLRTSEFIGLQWGDVSGEFDRVAVRRAVREGKEKVTKTSAGTRVVQLLSPAREVLVRLGRGDTTAPVFPHPVKCRRFHGDKAVRILFHRDCDAAGIRRRPGPYVLRHTFASLALSSGEPLGWVSAQMGHKDPWMTLRVYAKWVPSAFPDAGARMLQRCADTSS